ncbi:MAG: gamma-glutamylcyclotransferase family protein [Thermoanaerobaculia bacterium]
MSRIFFYGLFMDRSLLTGKGLHPETVGPAVLPGYRLHIGERATLLRSPGSRARGIVMELSDEEAGALYAEPSVREYLPERVRVELLDTGQAIEADVYNLPPESARSGANPAYAIQLAGLAEALGLDPDYVREIAAFAQPS